MIEVVQAFDREPFACLRTDDAAALEQKLSTAASMLAERSRWLEKYDRIEILQRLSCLVSDRRQHFSALIAREGGKPLTDALVETERAIDGIRYAADMLRVSAGVEIPMGLTRASVGRRAFTVHEPIGVVAAISAFNHPLNLIVHQVAPAVAAGCPVIVKPATATPLCCFDLVALLGEAGLPEGWVQTFLPDQRGLSEALATDHRIAFLSFIGSAETGWSLRSKLASGARCALEHGGVAPVIIDSRADLDCVIDPLVKGAYYHAGQVCVSVQRIYVHASLEREFVRRFSARVTALTVGDPQLPETEVGPLINPGEATRVANWIDEAVAGGACLIGGGRYSDTTLAPAILVGPSSHAKVSTHEVFGPVSCVNSFQHIDEAIARANSVPTAFQSSIFTEDLRTAFYAAERLNASAVMVNDHTAFRTDWMPFSGRGPSGHGVGGIPHTMQEMTAEKMIVFRKN